MRHHAFSLLLIVSFARIGAAQTVTADSLLAQILTTHVGIAGLPADLIIQGQVTDGAGTRALRMLVKGTNKVRYEQTQATHTTVSIYNAGSAWIGTDGTPRPVMPHAALRRPMELPFLDVIAEVGNPLLTVTYVGAETLAGRGVNHLALRLTDPTPERRFLHRALNEDVEIFADATTQLILRSQRMQAAANDMDFRVPWILDFSDYREVGSLKIPFRIVNTVGNASSGMSQVTIVIQSVAVNQGLDESLFQPPVR